jgi:hypothetical protein
MSRRDKRVDRQEAQGWRAVDDDMPEMTQDRVQAILEPIVRVDLPDQLGLQLCQRNTGRGN